MFGKKKAKINPFLSDLVSKIHYSMSDINDKPKKRHIVKFPMLPLGLSNTQIPQDWLLKIPLRDRPFWCRIDFDKVFADKMKSESNTEIEEDDIEAISQTPVDVKMLSQDSKLQIKAIALGLERDSEKSVGLQ